MLREAQNHVDEVVNTRQKQAKTRSLCVKNGHFDPAFNAAMTRQVTSRGLLKQVAFVLLALFPGAIFALSDDASSGKLLYKTCHACHDPDFDPPKAPPMFSVQQRYKKMTPDKDAFIDRIVSFTTNPQRGDAVMQHAVETVGLMPAMSIPEADLRKIAAYIYENQFDYPCAHWRAGMKRANAEGDMVHYEQDKKKLELFCAE